MYFYALTFCDYSYLSLNLFNSGNEIDCQAIDPLDLQEILKHYLGNDSLQERVFRKAGNTFEMRSCWIWGYEEIDE